MENKITVNVPEGYTLKKEKTENGLVLTFVKEEIHDEGIANFIRECLNGCTISLVKASPNSVFYNKDGNTMFELERSPNGKFYLWVNYVIVWHVFISKYRMSESNIRHFVKTQMEAILKMGEISCGWKNWKHHTNN